MVFGQNVVPTLSKLDSIVNCSNLFSTFRPFLIGTVKYAFRGFMFLETRILGHL